MHDVRGIYEAVECLGRTIVASATLFPKGVHISIYGGDKPHIGAVTIIGLDGEEETALFPTHRDDVVSRRWGKREGRGPFARRGRGWHPLRRPDEGGRRSSDSGDRPAARGDARENAAQVRVAISDSHMERKCRVLRLTEEYMKEREMDMKKHGWLAILMALVVMLGCIGVAHAEIIPPYGPGQQIGYPAVVLCDKLTLRDKPSASAKAIQSLDYGDQPIVIDADLPSGPQEENGFVYCTLGDSEDSPCGWIDSDYIVINPSWYVTEQKTSVYAWDDTASPKVALLDKGTRLPILKEDGDWYLVSLRGAVGWIHM